MISARRAALLGLDAPLSPIMAAVLGLWPQVDEPEHVIFWATGGGAPAATTAAARPPAHQRMDLSGLEMAMAQQAQERDLREAREVITALFALEGVF